MDLKEMHRALEAKRAEQKSIFDRAATGEVDPVTGAAIYNHEVMTPAMIQEVQGRAEELNRMEDSYQKARLADLEQKNAEALAQMSRANGNISSSFGPIVRPAPMATDGGFGGNHAGLKLSDVLFAHMNWKSRGASRNRCSVEIDDVDIKTLLQESSGYAPANPRGPIVVDFATRRPMVPDLIPSDPTTNQIITYMEQTTFTNNASTVDEGGLKPESADAWTERSSTVRKIACLLPVTEEQLDDVPGLQGLINRNLTLKLQQSEEDQILNGNNTGTNLLGILQAPNIQTQAFSANNADTAFMGFTKIRYTGFAEPSAVVMNPTNWQTIRLMKTSGSGEYILGNPLLDIDARLFGKPVVVTPAIALGTGLTGDFVQYAHISRKMGIRIDVSDSHDTYFAYNKLAIRAEERLSFEIYRQAAFCKLTSLT